MFDFPMTKPANISKIEEILFLSLDTDFTSPMAVCLYSIQQQARPRINLRGWVSFFSFSQSIYWDGLTNAS